MATPVPTPRHDAWARRRGLRSRRRAGRRHLRLNVVRRRRARGQCCGETSDHEHRDRDDRHRSPPRAWSATVDDRARRRSRCLRRAGNGSRRRGPRAELVERSGEIVCGCESALGTPFHERALAIASLDEIDHEEGEASSVGGFCGVDVRDARAVVARRASPRGRVGSCRALRKEKLQRDGTIEADVRAAEDRRVSIEEEEAIDSIFAADDVTDRER